MFDGWNVTWWKKYFPKVVSSLARFRCMKTPLSLVIDYYHFLILANFALLQFLYLLHGQLLRDIIFHAKKRPNRACILKQPFTTWHFANNQRTWKREQKPVSTIDIARFNYIYVLFSLHLCIVFLIPFSVYCYICPRRS